MRLCFDRFELDPDTDEVWENGDLVKLKPQPARVLALLAGQPGKLVTREDIQQTLWPDGTSVDFDLGINSCIRQIRIALGDDAEAPRYVQTVAKRGYRFLASVVTVTDAGSEWADTPTDRRDTASRLAPVLAGEMKANMWRLSLLAFLGATLSGFGWWASRSRVPPTSGGPLSRVEIETEPLDVFTRAVAFSRDGTKLAYVAAGKIFLSPDGS